VILLLTSLVGSRPRRVLACAAVLALISAALGAPAITALKSSSGDFQDPSSQYERANTMVHKASGLAPYYGVAALMSGTRPVATDPIAQRAVESMGRLLSHQRGFQQLLDYPNSQLNELISHDGRRTIILASYATPTESTAAIAHVRAALRRQGARSALGGLHVNFGGADVTFDELNRRTTSDLEHAEMLAIPVVFLLSLIVFRGVVAALLPPLVGGMAILVTFLLLRIVDQFTPISVFALNLVGGMGMGLGIDYSLFVLSRYREELAGGLQGREAIARTLQTAGRTVLYSSLTVAVALLSLLVFPIRFLSSMGIGGAFVALADGLVALVVLPALLLVLGARINALSPAWLQRRADRSARSRKEGAWWRLARGVMRRPGTIAFVTVATLFATAIPALSLKLAAPGANLLPKATESRTVEDALFHDFDSNIAEAIYIVVKAPIGTVQKIATEASQMGGHSVKTTPLVLLGHNTWEIDLLPHGSPFSSSEQQLVRRLRVMVRPYGGLVGGWTAYFIDQKSAIAAHALPAALILCLVTMTFLFLMTGSVLLPLKAFVMNMLTMTIGAGLLVVIFQDGHLSGPLGFASIGGLEEASLVLMFVVVFALSTDYEVFVLGRIKELRDAGHNNEEAVALGLERTGRIITAGAILFCVAVGALATTDVFFTKQFGLGTALAVAIDASIVRALLVPSLMALLGEWNWWAPRPLRRWHNRYGLSDGAPAVAPLTAGAE
jgi:putative drug exporter of the RND superfamily